MIDIIIGIILALVTTFCFNIAIVFQKKGLSQGRLSGAEINLGVGFKSTIKTSVSLYLEVEQA